MTTAAGDHTPQKPTPASTPGDETLEVGRRPAVPTLGAFLRAYFVRFVIVWVPLGLAPPLLAALFIEKGSLPAFLWGGLCFGLFMTISMTGVAGLFLRPETIVIGFAEPAELVDRLDRELTRLHFRPGPRRPEQNLVYTRNWWIRTPLLPEISVALGTGVASVTGPQVVRSAT